MKSKLDKLRETIFKLRLKNYILSPKKGNKLIGDLIRNKKDFAVCRIGLNEQIVMYNHVCNQPKQFEKIHAGGVWEDSYDDFVEEYGKGIASADLNVFWNGPFFEMDYKVLEHYSKDSKKILNKPLEPFYFKNPWSYQLKGKKVLVIHPFTKTVESQYQKRELLWDNPKILPEFELITYQSRFLNDLEEYVSWSDELKRMKEDISKLDFDVALMGCGTIGLPLVAFIKEEMGKGAIYIGGGLQLLFGIKGGRWNKERFPHIFNLYNENWVFASPEETPTKKGRKNLDSLVAYWDPSEKGTEGQ